MPGVANEWPSNAQFIYRSVERHCLKPLKHSEYPSEGTSIFFQSSRSFADGSRRNWRSDARLERRAGHLTPVYTDVCLRRALQLLGAGGDVRQRRSFPLVRLIYLGSQETRSCRRWNGWIVLGNRTQLALVSHRHSGKEVNCLSWKYERSRTEKNRVDQQVLRRAKYLRDCGG